MISPQGEAVESSIELRLPAKAEWVGVARLAIAGIASRLGLDMEEIDDLKLAVSEACNNCIQFAHAGDEVLITNTIYPDRLVVTVRDRVDASATGITQRRLGAAKEGGLGVFLIRTLMDEVSYETDARTGSRLTMTKRLKKS
jgi:serine/threonine-protein kinase RsbW